MALRAPNGRSVFLPPLASQCAPSYRPWSVGGGTVQRNLITAPVTMAIKETRAANFSIWSLCSFSKSALNVCISVLNSCTSALNRDSSSVSLCLQHLHEPLEAALNALLLDLHDGLGLPVGKGHGKCPRPPACNYLEPEIGRTNEDSSQFLAQRRKGRKRQIMAALRLCERNFHSFSCATQLPFGVIMLINSSVIGICDSLPRGGNALPFRSF